METSQLMQHGPVLVTDNMLDRFRKLKEPQSRPIGITLLSFFFLFGVLASGLTALMLLLPGTPLNALWHLNPCAQEGFFAMGRLAVVLMCTMCLACAAAAWGLWHCQRWAIGRP